MPPGNPLGQRPSIGANDLGSKLEQALKKREQVEKDYRNTNQKFWVIMFIDASSSAKPLWDLGEVVVNSVFGFYQERVRAVLHHKKCVFVEPGGGPQVVCCFETPELAIMGAHAVLKAIQQLNATQDKALHVMPAIGMHQGYVHYFDGTIHQSNTNNMAKRIQTEAKPGQMFVSSDLYEGMKADKRFAFRFDRTANLKNIPEPQDIYEVKVVVPDESNVNYLTLEAPPEPEPSKETQTKSKTEDPAKNADQSHDWVFAYIDVCESTKKFWKFGDRQARELIREYQVLCHETFKKNACDYVESSEGDQIVACFSKDKTENALKASVQILQGLFKRNVNVPNNRQVRAAIGMHAGEVIVHAGGNGLTTTKDMRIGKTIQGDAQADDLLISDTVKDLLPPKYHTDLEFYDECQLSGSNETHEMYSLKWFNMRNDAERTTLTDPFNRKPGGLRR